MQPPRNSREEAGKRKPVKIRIRMGISADAYGNIGGLIAALGMFVILAGSWFMFAQKFMIRSDYFMVIFILAIALAAFLLVKTYYAWEYTTTVTV
jgi:hypothetical protein